MGETRALPISSADLRCGASLRNNKFLRRILTQVPDSPPVIILCANSFLLVCADSRPWHGGILLLSSFFLWQSGSYIAAQAEYLQALRYFPDDPFLYFALGSSSFARPRVELTRVAPMQG